MGTRFLAAGALLMAWVLWRGRGGRRAAAERAREWRNALVIGALMLGGGMGLTASAEQHVGSGLVAAFIAVVPMLVCGWGLLFGQRPGRLEFVGMAVGVAGVLMLLRGASGASPQASRASPARRSHGRWAPCSRRRACHWRPGRPASPAKCCAAARS